MLRLNPTQRNFILSLYRETKGCYETVAHEFASKFDAICPPLRVVQSIVLEDEEVKLDDRIIRDVCLTQLSPPAGRRDRRLSRPLAYSVSVNQKSHALSLQNLRNAAFKCSQYLDK